MGGVGPTKVTSGSMMHNTDPEGDVHVTKSDAHSQDSVRTIVPLIDQKNIPSSGLGESGLGDIVASQFFSPKTPSTGGWIWGVGPVWSLPTASDDALGSGKLGLGPYGRGPETAGAVDLWSPGQSYLVGGRP